MNRRLQDPFQLTQLPETIEEYLEHGVATCLSFNRRGTLLATGTYEGQVVLWDWDTRGVARILQGHKGPITGVSWSRNGRYLASVCAGGLLLLWNLGEGVAEMELELPSAATGVSLRSVPPYQLAISLAEGPPLLLDASTGQQQLLPMLSESDLGIQPSSGGSKAAAAAAAAAQQADGVKKEGQAATPGAGQPPATVCFSKAGDMLFVGYARGGVIAVLDTQSLAFLDLIKLPSGARVLGMCLNRRGNYLLVNCHDKFVRLFEVMSRQPVQQQAQQLAASKDPSAGEGQGPGAAALPSLATVRACLQEKSFKSIKWGSLLWSAGSPSLLQLRREYQNAVERCAWVAMCISADDEHVLAAAQKKGGDHHLYNWNRHTGRMERILEGPKDGVCAVAWHPVRSSCMCSVTAGGRVLIWERVYAEQWSAFAPDFKELDENTEFVEAEDQFDWATPGATGNTDRSAAAAAAESGGGSGLDGGGGDPSVVVDALHVECGAVTVFSSDEEDELGEQLHHLPVEIEPEVDEAAAKEEGEADGNQQGGEAGGGEPSGTGTMELEGLVGLQLLAGNGAPQQAASVGTAMLKAEPGLPRQNGAGAGLMPLG